MTHHIFEYDPLKGNSGAMRDLGTLGCEEAAPDHYADKRFFPRMLIIGHDGNLYFAVQRALVSSDFFEFQTHIFAHSIQSKYLQSD